MVLAMGGIQLMLNSLRLEHPRDGECWGEIPNMVSFL